MGLHTGIQEIFLDDKRPGTTLLTVLDEKTILVSVPERPGEKLYLFILVLLHLPIFLIHTFPVTVKFGVPLAWPMQSPSSSNGKLKSI